VRRLTSNDRAEDEDEDGAGLPVIGPNAAPGLAAMTDVP
jgi:hypothetical protein